MANNFVIKKGTTSKRLAVFIQDSSKADGSGLAGLVFNSASLTCYYWREDEGNAGATVVALATMMRGTWATLGFVEKDATNMPGWYEFGVPNAAIITGATWVKFEFKGAANMAATLVEIQLVSYDPDDAVRLGLTALPNAAANAAGGLPISTAGALDMDAILSRIGAPSDLGSGASLAKNLVDVESQTDDIGVAGAGLTALGDARIANLDVTISSRSTYAGGAVAGVTAPVTVGTNSDKTGYALTAGERTTLAGVIVGTVIEGTETLTHILRLIRAAVVGKSNTFPLGPANFRDAADLKNRITVTVDGNGNRTNVVTDGT